MSGGGDGPDDDSFYTEIVFHVDESKTNDDGGNFSDDSFDLPIVSSLAPTDESRPIPLGSRNSIRDDTNQQSPASRTSSGPRFVNPSNCTFVPFNAKDLPNNAKAKVSNTQATQRGDENVPVSTANRLATLQSPIARHGSDNSFFRMSQAANGGDFPNSQMSTFAQAAAPGEVILLRRQVDNARREKERLEKEHRKSLGDQQTSYLAKIHEKEAENKKLRLELELAKNQQTTKAFQVQRTESPRPTASPMIPLAGSTPIRKEPQVVKVQVGKPTNAYAGRSGGGSSGFRPSPLVRSTDMTAFRHHRELNERRDETTVTMEDTFDMISTKMFTPSSTSTPKSSSAAKQPIFAKREAERGGDSPPAKRRPFANSATPFRSPFVGRPISPILAPSTSRFRDGVPSETDAPPFVAANDLATGRKSLTPEEEDEVRKAIEIVCRNAPDWSRKLIKSDVFRRVWDPSSDPNAVPEPPLPIFKPVKTFPFTFEPLKSRSKSKKKVKEQEKPVAARGNICLHCKMCEVPKFVISQKETYQEVFGRKQWETEEERRVAREKLLSFVPMQELAEKQRDECTELRESGVVGEDFNHVRKLHEEAMEELRVECTNDYENVRKRTLHELREAKLREIEEVVTAKVRNNEMEDIEKMYFKDDYVWTSDDTDSECDEHDLDTKYCGGCIYRQRYRRRRQRCEKAVFKFKVKGYDLLNMMDSLSLDFKPAKRILEEEASKMRDAVVAIPLIDLTRDESFIMEDDFEDA